MIHLTSLLPVDIHAMPDATGGGKVFARVSIFDREGFLFIADTLEAHCNKGVLKPGSRVERVCGPNGKEMLQIIVQPL